MAAIVATGIHPRALRFGDVIRTLPTDAAYRYTGMVICQEDGGAVTYVLVIDNDEEAQRSEWPLGWIEPIYADDLSDYELLT